jgi:hypothetical protein
VTHGTPSAWVARAVSTFGESCAAKLAGPGDREAAIRSPLETLLGAAGGHLGVQAVFHDEVRDSERQVRPDYGVRVQGAITGYVEVKAPGKSIDPARFSGHDKRQWERQRDLPNLIYTNGTEWRLYRDGAEVGDPVSFVGDLKNAAGRLEASPAFEELVTDFLRWQPAPITSVGALVRAVAPLTRLLRGEVLDQLESERKATRGGADEYAQPFLGLARDWRALLFPSSDDATFADGYAQAVTFALLLARTEEISLTGRPLHQIGADLGAGHSLMGKALQLLTGDVAADFKVTLDLLVRVVGAVDWARVRRGRRDTYLHLYEHFLEEYDNELRKRSGSYYTPRDVVEEMVRLTEETLVTRLGKTMGFRDDTVLTVDPAMGTGTYLHTILERVAEQATEADGPGAVPGALSEVAQRLVGFELQMGPYAVAELRASDLLASHGAAPPRGGMHLYVTDALDDPYAVETQIGSGLQLIARSRRKANQVKANASVTVVVGNPPYRERAEGMGGWVERGSAAHGRAARGILDDYRDPATARHFHNLKNLYVYFWRWATWKVWESSFDEDGGAGVVCFISTAGYVAGPGFTGMREYLRRHASEGWIIELTPEGQTPDIPTRIFPGVRQPLAIGLFIRTPETRQDEPAVIHHRSVHGRRAEKFAALQEITLDGEGWRPVRTGWKAPLTPAASGDWDSHPALGDIFPWTSPGVTGNRRWPFAPSPQDLQRRWTALRAESDEVRRRELFKETRDRSLRKSIRPLPGIAQATEGSLEHDRGPMLAPVRIGYRSFDRQWLVPDARVLDMPRAALWAARIPGQVFLIEQHSLPIEAGPGLVFTSLIPDLHYFNGRGGRAVPLLHPDGSANLAPGVLRALGEQYGREVEPIEVLSYVAGLVASPAYTATFSDELTTPGIRVPVTAEGALFDEVVEVGRNVLWAQTYGASCSGQDRPLGEVRYARGDPRQPLALTPVTQMPTEVSFDSDRAVILLGDGEFGPVSPGVWEYSVGGKNVVKSWVNYRKAEPGGKRTSPLDRITSETWDPTWTGEFIDLLTVLTRLIELESRQAELLEKVLAEPLLTQGCLSQAGTRWPTIARDRIPRFAASNAPVDSDSAATLEL